MYDFNTVGLDMVMVDVPTWLCKGTGLTAGSVLKGMLGYEIDRIDPKFSPSGIRVLASSPYKVCIDAKCSTWEIRHANMTYYSAQSGALVFATGSMQWN